MDSNQTDRRGQASRGLTTYIAHERTKERAKQARLAQNAINTLNQLQTDSLTGLPSTRALDDLIENFNPSDYPADTRIFCVYIDLKGVKQINDTDGHLAGDEYIRNKALAIASCFRTESGADILFRPTGTFRQHTTGDEFLVLLTCPNDNSETLIELINNRLASINPDLQYFRYGISHNSIPTEGMNNKDFFDALIDSADKKANQSRSLDNN